MQTQEKNFISLLRASVSSQGLAALSEPDYVQILLLAKKHAVAGLLYPAVKRISPSPAILPELKKLAFGAATREQLQSQELAQITAACEDAKIPVLLLKGCILKSLYPIPSLRYMSDIDLLIDPRCAKETDGILRAMGFSEEKTDASSTVVYSSPQGMRYEIHLQLSSEGYDEASKRFASELMARSVPAEGKVYIRNLPLEDHYAYLLCHFVKHFIYGGIGIRQLIDIYLCRKKWQMDEERLASLLDELGLTEFHQKLTQLSAHWFENAEAEPSVFELGDYILSSGVFGSEDHRSTDRMLRQGEGFAYLWRRTFPPYRTMKEYFPVLKKLPFLLPFFWIWRAVRAVLFRRKKLKAEVSAFESTDSETIAERAAFYQRCGLALPGKGGRK